jgi:protein arginine kinase
MSSHELTPAIAQLSAPWHDHHASDWMASTLTLQRNIDNFKFPGKMDVERRQQAMNLLAKELMNNSELIEPQLLLAEEITPLEKEYLVEHFLSFQNFQQAHSGEGFLIDQSGLFLIGFNLANHLQMTLIDVHGDLEKSLARLLKIESALTSAINYAFSPKFGFLTADPHQAGTAFTVAIYLQLPALAQSGELDDLIKKYQDEQVIVSGIQGSPTEIIGDVVVLQNNITLGVSEEGILTNLRNISGRLQAQEKSARQHLREQEKPAIKDHVSRAYGVLIHSYQLEAIEALDALSLLKLGVDLEWVKGVSTEVLNQLFFACRRAHLIGKTTGPTTVEELPHRRAEYLHKALAHVTLTF